MGQILRFFIQHRVSSHIGAVTLALIASQLLAAPAIASERIALVIGNGGYTHLAPLDHVQSDIAVMADTLRSLDFDVEAVNDLDRPAMEDRIADFGARIDQAGKETIGLLFYAGHGFALEGSNYLLPIDAAITDVGDVDKAAINLDLTLAEIAFATNDHKLVILDVPAKSGVAERIGISPGLVAIDAPVGTLVAYGALPSTDDREPRHRGLYPLALASALAKPGLMVEQVFQEARLNVAEATDGVQIPWESSSLNSPVYLAGPPQEVDDPAIDDGAVLRATPIVSLDPRTVDLVFWTGVKDSDDPADFADYLESFPNGVFRSLAERRLEALSDVAPSDPSSTKLAYSVDDLDEAMINAPMFAQRLEVTA